MKVKNLKTRIAAFGLAVLMGVSTLSSANAFAAEQTDVGQEVQASEQAVTSQKEKAVTADDITKEISDETFAVETSMEGIHYDAKKEDVTLISIQDENGGEYHPDKAGTYIASYMVVPKDQSDSYTISRKVILTDTEGQAHAQDNGGEKQKSDTKSEDDSDSPVQNYTDVEIEASGEDASAQAIEELKEDIEEGNVMVLSAAERATSSGSTVTLTKGRTIYYPSYIGNYLTCLFTVNGKIAYCLQSQKASPPSGSYVAQVLDSNKNLQKVLYYGYGGAGDLTGSYLSGKSEDEKYVYTHIAASYAYAGEAGFTGCNYNDLVNAGVIAYINYLFGQEEPPKGELSLSSTKLNAVRDGNLQKTPNITLSGDHRNYVTLSVPEHVTAHNLTKGTSVTNGKIQIYGGDTFYLSADLLLTGSYASGNLYGSVGKTWRTLVLTTGDSKQDIGVFESETAAPVSFSVQWLNMTRIELTKKDINTQNPLSGAVYGIYTDKKCENLLMTMTATGTDGKAVSDYFDAALKTVYVKEVTAPTGYKRNQEVYQVDVAAGKTLTLTATDERVTGKVKIAKIDKETLAFQPQGDGALRGAVYGLYAKEDIVHPDGTTGVLYKQDSLIAQGVIDDDGTLEFSELYLGEMYVKEITPPEGYTLDTTRYEVSVTYEGQDVAEVTRDLTVKEQVKKQAFQLIKISEDGEQTETDLVAGAGFQVYLISSLSQVKNGKLKPANGESYTASDFKNYDFSKEQVAVTYENGTAVPVPELITDTKGYAVSPELPYGSYVVVESITPENLKTIDPFVVNVEDDSREPMQWRVFDDRPFEFLLKIVKKDAQTGNTVLKAGASYKIYDVTNKKYVEQVVQYPKKEKISVFKTNEEGYLITPQELKCSTYRIKEVKAPEGFVRQGSEESLYDGTTIISPLEQTAKGTYKENPPSAIEITVSSNTAHQIDPDTGAAIVEVEQKNDEQVGSLLLTKKGEQLTEVTGDSVLAKVKALVSKVRNAVSGKEETGIYKDFKYEETGVEGAQFEVYAKDTIYSPDGAKDEEGNPVVRYEKDDLVVKLTTDENGTAVINNLPLGTYYLKEVVAGENFVLNTEQKEFTLTAEDEEDILSNQGEVLVEKDTLLEKKATDTKGTLTFDSDLPHGKYYVKEEVRKAELNKEVENQPTETRITKTDATTGNELEGAKLQVIDKDGTVLEEWISTKEEHVIYGLPEGSYTLHEELAPYEDGYVSASDVTFEVKEDGSVTKVEMKDEYSKVEISKTDLTTGKELEGAKLQIIRKDGTVLEEWITDGKPHSVAKLPVNEELTLREITAPDGYEIAEDVTFTLKDTMEVQKVEMKDARTPEKTTEKTNAPKTGDNQKVWPFVLLALASAGTATGVTVYRRKKSKMTDNKEETEEK
ncbi:SpaA isopeptide-forming pilin-related protein [Dorea amylophila]|uniref:SpaA isopeptide-forming pilin-related protein n=1 Tax=Dorea amylophila TaxID=2981789 RepID=UPI0022E60574|nr:SpaA isopeptide-forming pilin-related protein [Dorea amylophila]